jgi:hypothetical protein
VLKRIVLAAVQFIAFAILLGIGGYWDIVRLVMQLRPGLKWLADLFPLLRFQVTANHVLVANGILFAGILCVLILLIEALRKASRSTMLITVFTYVVAVILSLALKIGLPPAS